MFEAEENGYHITGVGGEYFVLIGRTSQLCIDYGDGSGMILGVHKPRSDASQVTDHNPLDK